MTKKKQHQNPMNQSLLKRKQQLLKGVKFPEDGLSGSLVMSRYRCGKKSCHCYRDEGHQKWSLTFMNDGAKRVIHIPADLIDEVQKRVEQGKTFKESINQIFAANAELLILLRKERN
jgi:hypothetical protein